ncbi:16S rRNA (cytidine(1402)-2'-O)-methyltransferase [Candidatus Latescibacterota bacterium]
MNTTLKSGCLYVVSTPIGNLGDLSDRARSCLADVDIIACEDTRHSGKLLSRLGLKKRLVSYNDINAERRLGMLTDHLVNGSDVALISDAGTPGISDPAYRLVRVAVDEGFDVISIPGPSAVLAGLVVSGLPLDRFTFEGFLPPKAGARNKRLESLKSEQRTMVLYESPHRILKLLDAILAVMGNREVSVSRELTKLHEETVRGFVSDVLDRMNEKKPRGEYTVVIRGIGKKGLDNAK